jgi:hypothetical protein
MLRTFTTFVDADAARQDGDVVSGTFLADSETPVYFLVRADASPEACRRAAFEARYGKPMDPYQEKILGLAEAGVV